MLAWVHLWPDVVFSLPLQVSPPRWKTSTQLRWRRRQISFVHPRDNYKSESRRKGEDTQCPWVITQILTHFGVKSLRHSFAKVSHRAFVPDSLPGSTLLAEIRLTWHFSGTPVLRQLTSHWNRPHLIPQDSRDTFLWKQLKCLMMGEFRQTRVL